MLHRVPSLCTTSTPSGRADAPRQVIGESEKQFPSNCRALIAGLKNKGALIATALATRLKLLAKELLAKLRPSRRACGDAQAPPALRPQRHVPCEELARKSSQSTVRPPAAVQRQRQQSWPSRTNHKQRRCRQSGAQGRAVRELHKVTMSMVLFPRITNPICFLQRCGCGVMSRSG